MNHTLIRVRSAPTSRTIRTHFALILLGVGHTPILFLTRGDEPSPAPRGNIMPNAYEVVTERLIAKLEEGIIPWRQPWKNTSRGAHLPCNFTTGRSYRGINSIMLLCSGYQSVQWMIPLLLTDATLTAWAARNPPKGLLTVTILLIILFSPSVAALALVLAIWVRPLFTDKTNL